MTQSYSQLMRAYIDVLNENDNNEEFWSEFDRVIDGPTYEERVEAALSDIYKIDQNSNDYLKKLNEICDQHDVDPIDLEDAIREVEEQERENREYDHWGTYD